jgi:hypothetical protein
MREPHFFWEDRILDATTGRGHRHFFLEIRTCQSSDKTDCYANMY